MADFPVLAPAPAVPALGCPCISAAALLAERAPSLLAAEVPEGLCPGFANLAGDCLPEGFGSGQCRAWDNLTGSQLSLCRQQPPAAWCGHEWCYVDGKNCEGRTFHPATYRFRGRALPGNASLAYSYTTCLHRDVYSRSDVDAGVREALAALRLRVTMPLVGSPTPHFWREDARGNRVPVGMPRGPIWDMVKSFADEFGVTLLLQETTPNAMEASGTTSSWWACIQEVAVNATDLCLGDFWYYPERQLFMSPGGTYSRSFSEAEFVLSAAVGREGEMKEQSFAELLAIPLRPFTWRLWLLVFATILLHGLAYWLVELLAARTRLRREPEQQESNADTSTPPAVLKRRPSHVSLPGLYHQNLREEMVKAVDPSSVTLVSALYSSVSVIRGTPPIDPRSNSSRLVHLGYKLFLMAALTYWGSGITRQLVQDSLDRFLAPRAQFTDLEDAQRSQAKICSQGTLGNRLLSGEALPAVGLGWDPAAMRSLMVPPGDARGGLPNSASGSMEAMRAGYCTGVVAELNQLYSAFYKNGDRHCGTRIVGPSVIDAVLIAMPVRAEKESLVSYLISKYMSTQRYSQSLTEAKLNKWPIECHCAVTPGGVCPTEQVQGQLQVDASHLTLFFLLTAVLTLSGLFCALSKQCSTVDRGWDGHPGGLC